MGWGKETERKGTGRVYNLRKRPPVIRWLVTDLVCSYNVP